jgi:hypothetical protein
VLAACIIVASISLTASVSATSAPFSAASNVAAGQEDPAASL